MTVLASVQVPLDDAAALAPLRDTSTAHGEPVTTHPFDGVVMLQVLVPVTAASVSIIKQWIVSRQEARKSYRIVVDGIDISGYSASEAEKILKSLDASESADELGDGAAESGE